MLDQIEGTYINGGDRFAIIKVGDMFFRVEMTKFNIREIKKRSSRTARIYTHLIFTDHFVCYGFLSPEERDFFNLLQTIHRVGHKLALTIMHTYKLAELQHYILDKDYKRILQIPGVGRQMGNRILQLPIEREG